MLASDTRSFWMLLFQFISLRGRILCMRSMCSRENHQCSASEFRYLQVFSNCLKGAAHVQNIPTYARGWTLMDNQDISPKFGNFLIF